jgi:hypothetical protein
MVVRRVLTGSVVGQVISWRCKHLRRRRRPRCRPCVQQDVEDSNVIAAGGPMQRGFGVRACEPDVHVGAGFNERDDGGDPVEVVAPPVGGHVQQRPGHAVRPLSTELRQVVAQQPPQQRHVARGIVTSVSRARKALRTPAYASSTIARDLHGQIEAFCQVPAAALTA